ncbi:hypothetical protein N8387_09210 [Polaribacter sp.]|nr:hypothetical protein [Polaribacter sp.]
MKKFSLKIVSILMAFVVVFTTLSFTVDMHFCGDTLVETAVFQKVKGCGMELEKPSKDDCVVKSNNCCNDKKLTIDGQQELQISVNAFSFEQPLYVSSILNTSKEFSKVIDKNILLYKGYTLQLVIRQLYKIAETYLI